jgi:hypothetical protein
MLLRVACLSAHVALGAAGAVGVGMELIVEQLVSVKESNKIHIICFNVNILCFLI